MKHYDIEIVDACNLRCPSCPRGNSLDVPRAKGHMKLELFEQVLAKIVRENPGAESIGLFNWGEPLLHPTLPEIVRTVKRYGLACDLSSNLNVVKNLEEVIAAGPDHFRVSLSGFQQKNYSLTHKTGNVETVKANMRALRAAIDRTGSSCEVQVLFHMYLHNMEEDFALMRAFCQELRFTMNPVWAYLMPVEKVLAYYGGSLPDKDQAIVDLLVIKPEEARQVSRRHPLRDCPLRADQLAINANGSVPLCCGVFEPKHTVAVSFLDFGPAELKKARYSNELCRPCMANAIHSTATYQGLDELNKIAEARFRERGLHFRFSSSVPPFVEVEDLNPKLTNTQHPTPNTLVVSDTRRSTRNTRNPEVGTLNLPTDIQSKPKLSILIPTYNRAEMLRECLQSSLTAPADSEIVVIDNGSTDHTTEVLQSFVERDRRVRVVRQEENVGPLRNFQRALDEARGDYICLTGDDDMFLPGNFQKKLALLDACPEIGLVYSQWLRIDEQSRSQGVVMWPGVLPYSYVGTRDEFRDLLPASYMMFQAVVFRRALYDQLGGFDEHPDRLVGNDWDLLLRYCHHTKTAFIAEPLVAVRVHQQSFTESVARKDGKFAPGRTAIWRKWLVEHDNPPVLDEALWRRMADAFLPDLSYEFGQDQARIDYYLQQLETVKRDSTRKIAQVAEQRLSRRADTPRPTSLPGPANIADFSNCSERLTIAGARGFNFLSIFDWELRSGWDLLVSAFVAEFDPTEDVALILRTRPGSGNSIHTSEIGGQLVSFLRDTLGRDPEDIPDIVLETTDLPDHQLPALYRAADCFVLASRGETWSGRCVEAMASALPVIGTKWGGNTEIMSTENSFLVECTISPVSEEAVQETPQFAGQRCAEPNVDHLRSQLRRVFESRELAARIGRAGQREILLRFDPTVATNRNNVQVERPSRTKTVAA